MEQETRTTLTKTEKQLCITTGSMVHVGTSQASAPFESSTATRQQQEQQSATEQMASGSDDDYRIKLHVIHAGVTIAVCDPYCEADGMTLEEIRDAFEEGLGRYLYKDGYGWKFNMPRQKLKKLIQDRWLLNGEVVGTEYNDGIVKPCDSLEVHMVVDADGDSESCRSESDSEHGDKTITPDVEASDTIETEI